ERVGAAVQAAMHVEREVVAEDATGVDPARASAAVRLHLDGYDRRLGGVRHIQLALEQLQPVWPWQAAASLRQLRAARPDRRRTTLVGHQPDDAEDAIGDIQLALMVHEPIGQRLHREGGEAYRRRVGRELPDTATVWVA